MAHVAKVNKMLSPANRISSPEEQSLQKRFYENLQSCSDGISGADTISTYKEVISKFEELTITPESSANPEENSVSGNSYYRTDYYANSQQRTSYYSEATPSITSGNSLERISQSPLRQRQNGNDFNFPRIGKDSEATSNIASSNYSPMRQRQNNFALPAVVTAPSPPSKIAAGDLSHFNRSLASVPNMFPVQSGEEDEIPKFAHRAKLYAFDSASKQWVKRGDGELKIVKHYQIMRFRMILRQDNTQRVVCNQYLTKDMSLFPMPNSRTAVCWNAFDYSKNPAEISTFAARFASEKVLEAFKNIFNECVDVRKRCFQLSSEYRQNNNNYQYSTNQSVTTWYNAKNENEPGESMNSIQQNHEWPNKELTQGSPNQESPNQDLPNPELANQELMNQQLVVQESPNQANFDDSKTESEISEQPDA